MEAMRKFPLLEELELDLSVTIYMEMHMESSLIMPKSQVFQVERN
jgi:hypothetical protein